MNQAVDLARQALAHAQRGDDAAASALFAQGLVQFPSNAQLFNSAGNFHARAGRNEEALQLFKRGLALDPGLAECGVNAAIVLLRLERAGEALSTLCQIRPVPNTAQYWSLRGDAERLLGAWDAAAASYQRAAHCNANHPRTLAGRARLSLERGETRAVEDYERALAQTPGDPLLFHDYILSLADGGELARAVTYAEALVEKLPNWPPGHLLCADLRRASGAAAGWDDTFARAADTHPSPQLYQAWSSMLAGIDRHADAASVLERARARWKDDPQLALSHAVALGEAGEAHLARAILEQFPHDAGDWLVARARNLLQLGEVEQAEALLGSALEGRTFSVEAWALVDLCWRLQGDPRHEWLHLQPGLVRKLPLGLDADDLAAATDCLERLHERSWMPLGQSIKQGSQTKGALFARRDPELEKVRQALEAVLEVYRDGLPPCDPDHPLLSRRNSPWSISGSWSIRMDGRGLHAAHIHPRGLLSSACYFLLPSDGEATDKAGWLELGRPPPRLAETLGPLQVIQPEIGHCALFPSTLFHGTRPINAGIRMTVAFDVTAAA